MHLYIHITVSTVNYSWKAKVTVYCLFLSVHLKKKKETGFEVEGGQNKTLHIALHSSVLLGNTVSV